MNVGSDLIQIAFADTREEAALIRGLLREEGIRSLAKQGWINGPARGAGLLTRSTRRIYVRSEDADPARKLLGETMVEDPAGEEIPEPANAAYLAEAAGSSRGTTPFSARTPGPGSSASSSWRSSSRLLLLH